MQAGLPPTPLDVSRVIDVLRPKATFFYAPDLGKACATPSAALIEPQ